MQRQLLTIAIVGIIIIGAVTAGGYYLGKVIQKPKTASNNDLFTSPSPSASTEPTFTPTPSPAAPSLLPTAPPAQKGSATAKPKAISNANNVTPVTASTGTTTTKDVAIRFVGVPNVVNSNESFTISWYIDGPDGKIGTSTRLTSSYNASNSGDSGSSSASSTTSQAFGEFMMPQKFQSNVKFGGNPGPITLKATAEIDGKTYTATQTIQLAD